MVTLQATNDPMRFLGYQVDSDNDGSAHVDYILGKAQKKLLDISRIRTHCSPHTFGELYKSEVLSILLYGSAGWYPIISVNAKARLETFHRKSVATVANIPGTTNTARVYEESGFLDFATYVKCRTMDILERTHNRPANHPLHLLISNPHPALNPRKIVSQHVTARPTIRAFGHDLLDPQFVRLPERLPAHDPLRRLDVAQLNHKDINFGRAFIEGRGAHSNVERRLQTNTDLLLPQLDEHSTSLLVLADASVGNSAAHGGRRLAAYSFTLFRYERDTGLAGMIKLLTVSKNIGACHSSFMAEYYAIRDSLEAVLAHLRAPGNGNTYSQVVLASDSLAAISRLSSKGPLRQNSISTSIWEDAHFIRTLTGRPLRLNFIYSHCNFVPHDEVDVNAKHALGLPIHQEMVSVSTAAKLARKPHINAFIDDVIEGQPQPSLNQRFRRVPVALPLNVTAAQFDVLHRAAKRRSCTDQFVTLPRLGVNTARLLFQLRAGVCPSIGGWRKPTARDPGLDPCPFCARMANRDTRPTQVEHIFNCPGIPGWADDIARRTQPRLQAFPYPVVAVDPWLLWSANAVPLVVELIKLLKAARRPP